MNWIKRIFHAHDYIFDKIKDYWYCSICFMVPYCEKHKRAKYVHGWDNLVDCIECVKEKIENQRKSV